MACDLQNQGYSVQHNALPASVVKALRDTLLSLNADQFKHAGVGRAHQQMSSNAIRRDTIFWIENNTAAEGQWLEFANLLQSYLNRSLLLGLFSFESHFAHYSPGAFYKTHVDAFKGQANRVLSVVLYLNEDWSADDGGEMVLYDSDDNLSTVLSTINPEAGTLAVFLSEDFPHEVLPAKRDRYSIAGWYRVNTSSGSRVDPPV